MLRTLILILFFPIVVAAQDMPRPLNDTVSDYANLLDAPQEANLTKILKTARDQTGVHIVVVTMARTADYGGSGQSIETYANNLFNAWGIGDKQRNDGILILVANQDREMRIALGDGFDSVYENYALRVINQTMLPTFKAGDYPKGILTGTQSTINLIARPFAQHNPPPPIDNPNGASQPGFFLLIAFATLLVTFRRKIGDAFTKLRACPNCGQRTLSRMRRTLTNATRMSAGQGTQITRCSSCAHETRTPYSIPQLSDSSRGSGGGFGGGRSSGGGASGRW